MGEMKLALVVLLTGLVVVFVMLILLTLIIKIYGSIIYNAKKNNKKKANNLPVKKDDESTKALNISKSESIEDNKGGISEEIVAVIAAAVSVFSESEGKNYKINDISPVLENKFNNRIRSVWSLAGLLENTKPF